MANKSNNVLFYLATIASFGTDSRPTTADAVCKTAYRGSRVAWYKIIFNQSEQTKQNCAKTCDIRMKCTAVYEKKVSKTNLTFFIADPLLRHCSRAVALVDVVVVVVVVFLCLFLVHVFLLLLFTHE
jgi:cobalamin biosynthesis protein CobD/CbiB